MRFVFGIDTKPMKFKGFKPSGNPFRGAILMQEGGTQNIPRIIPSPNQKIVGDNTRLQIPERKFLTPEEQKVEEQRKIAELSRKVINSAPQLNVAKSQTLIQQQQNARKKEQDLLDYVDKSAGNYSVVNGRLSPNYGRQAFNKFAEDVVKKTPIGKAAEYTSYVTGVAEGYQLLKGLNKGLNLTKLEKLFNLKEVNQNPYYPIQKVGKGRTIQTLREFPNLNNLKKPIDNIGYTPPITDPNLKPFISYDPDFQKGGPIVSKRGQWDYPYQETIVPTEDGRITMRGVNYPLLGISLDTGENKIMYPNKNYRFKNTSKVLEIPYITKPYYKNGGIIEGEYDLDLEEYEVSYLKSKGYKVEYI